MRPSPTTPKRLVRQLRAHVVLAVPPAGLQTLVGRRDVAGQTEHQRKRVFRRAQRVAGRRVHDHDAVTCGRSLVDVVGADAGPHDRAQATIALQRLRGDLHAAAADRAVRLGQRLAEFVTLQAGANLVLDTLRSV